MHYTAIFRDGPLGGQYRELNERLPVFRALSMPRLGAAAFARGVTDVAPMLTEEVYDLEGTWHGTVLEYRWRNPAESLRAENKRLRAQLDEAKASLNTKTPAHVHVHINGEDVTEHVVNVSLKVGGSRC